MRRGDGNGGWPGTTVCPRRWVVGIAMLAASLLTARAQEPVFVTWDTVEPDKCIAAWLIKTHVHTNAVFRFVPKGSPVTHGIPFDIPGSTYLRDARRSASEVVIDRHGITDPKAVALGRIARKFELGRWHAVFTERERPLADELSRLWQSEDEPKTVLQAAWAALDKWAP